MFCLRLLFAPVSIPTDPFSVSGAVHLLELRGARMVLEHTKRVHAKEIDGSADWRVSRAVAEAFVARRVGDLVQQANRNLSPRSSNTICALFRLV